MEDTLELWQIRDHIYEIRPDITRDFLTESRNDRPRYEKLAELFHLPMTLRNKETVLQRRPCTRNCSVAVYMDGLSCSPKRGSIGRGRNKMPPPQMSGKGRW